MIDLVPIEETPKKASLMGSREWKELGVQRAKKMAPLWKEGQVRVPGGGKLE